MYADVRSLYTVNVLGKRFDGVDPAILLVEDPRQQLARCCVQAHLLRPSVRRIYVVRPRIDGAALSACVFGVPFEWELKHVLLLIVSLFDTIGHFLFTRTLLTLHTVHANTNAHAHTCTQNKTTPELKHHHHHRRHHQTTTNQAERACVAAP